MSRDVWCATHAVIVRYGAEQCARGRPSTVMFNCHFMLLNLCFASKVNEIGRISVVMYVSDHFVGILSMGNCS